MTLKTFLRREGWSLSKAAEEFGCSKAYAGFLVQRKRVPSMDMASRIEKATGNKVTVYDLMKKAA